VILVDDHLAGRVFSGHRDEIPIQGRVVTTWGFHYRLVRALTDERGGGRLTRATGRELLDVVSKPPASLLQVLDPREATPIAAQLAIKHRLNALSAELFGSAVAHDATVVLTEANVGRPWRSVMASESIPHRIIRPTLFAEGPQSSSLRALTKASWGTSTRPIDFIFFLPSF
jgi:hypothetical protein